MGLSAPLAESPIEESPLQFRVESCKDSPVDSPAVDPEILQPASAASDSPVESHVETPAAATSAPSELFPQGKNSPSTIPVPAPGLDPVLGPVSMAPVLDPVASDPVLDPVALDPVLGPRPPDPPDLVDLSDVLVSPLESPISVGFHTTVSCPMSMDYPMSMGGHTTVPRKDTCRHPVLGPSLIAKSTGIRLCNTR
jgi:hypothetical protein